MQNNLMRVVALALLAFSGLALADETANRLTTIEGETLILKAREKQLEVQANIITKQNEIAARQNVSTMITQTAVVGDPVVRAIEGFGQKMYATLQLSDGNVVDVQAGDMLSNGMRIVSILGREVVAENKSKRRVRLAAYGQAPVEFNSSFPSPRLALPLPPAVPKGAAK